MTASGRIRTVLGDVPPEPWGITNAHAHLVGVPDTSKPPFDTTDAAELTMTIDDSLPEVEDFARARRVLPGRSDPGRHGTGPGGACAGL